MNKLLANVRIVLVHTSHSGNVGAVARAMKVMALEKLYLVKPVCDPFNGLAKAMATNATDVWQGALVVNDLDQALQGVHVVFGTTARSRSFSRDLLTPRNMATELGTHLKRYPKQEIAVVFGCEQSGLSNHELDRCHYQVMIPTNPCYSSLNLAQAVQIICYEIYQWLNGYDIDLNMSSTKPSSREQSLDDLAASDAVEGVYQHLEHVMKETFFYKPKNPSRMETRLRQIFNRARLRSQDVHLLRGLLNAVSHRINNLSATKEKKYDK